MRAISLWALSLAVSNVLAAQARDPDKLVKDGGVLVPGWVGRLDPAAEKRGAKLTDAKFFPAGDGMHVTAGPPAIYWHPANKGTGAYTVKATFTQTRAPEHPEYYGLFMGGSQLEKEPQNYLYCVLAGNGTFTVKHRYGGEVHELAGRTASPAIRKASAEGQATNEVALKVTPERTACVINGTEVWGYANKALIGPGKLVSTDGLAGIRVNHNLDIHVSGFVIGKG
jgi:hypothetical protein